MKYFRILAITCLLTWVNGWAVAQDTIRLDWSDLHYLSEEEMLSGERSVLFNETNPPAGDYVRFPAEFEPMQAVTIRYPLGIPLSFVKQLSQRTKVYVIVKQSLQSTAHNKFQQAGCKMSNIYYFNMTTDSYWVRDYGPWYIFNDLQPAIVDNVYNRPRQYDNMVPVNMGQLLGLPVYGMNLTHTGGNMMEDGRGIGVSDELVLTENGNNATNVRNKMNNYLGVDPYHITIDPQGYYIAHVDCWGKFLAPDKILIARLPQSNIQYDEYESVANFFANTNCCWGYPYKVYRVDEPGGYVLAPYTNSLIVNKTVFVPLGTNTTYNNNALAVYREAMPGYEVIGVASNSDYPWKNTDALHCRARGVMDFNMLFVDHRDVIHGEVPMQDSIAYSRGYGVDNGRNYSNSDSGFWLNIPTIRKVLEQMPKQLFIFADCCNFMCLESIYELRNVTDYVIGSPAEIPDLGAPYSTVVPAMFKHNSSTSSIIDGFATRDVLKTIAALPEGYAVKDSTIHYYYDGSKYYDFNPSYNIFFDAGDYVRSKVSDADYRQWREALDNAVVVKHISKSWETNKSWYRYYSDFTVTEEKFHGVSMFVPQESPTSYYAKYNEDIKKFQWYYKTYAYVNP